MPGLVRTQRTSKPCSSQTRVTFDRLFGHIEEASDLLYAVTAKIVHLDYLAFPRILLRKFLQRLVKRQQFSRSFDRHQRSVKELNMFYTTTALLGFSALMWSNRTRRMHIAAIAKKCERFFQCTCF